MDEVLIVIFLSATIIQSYFWWGQLGSLSRLNHQAPSIPTDFPSVAILVAAKNEAENLQKLLPILIGQTYPSFQIYVINDHSADNTEEIVKSFLHPSISLIDLPEGVSGKKGALEYGIRQIKEDWIITTDADCYPNSPLWVTEMMHQHSTADVLLGYSPYENKTNTFLETLIQYESWFVAMQYISAALLGRAYMGVGRNLAFRKTLFQAVGGYEKHLFLPGGDDDLFISSLPPETRFAVVTSSNAWVWTDPKKSFRSYWEQKRRHLTTAPHYKPTMKLWLAIIFISQLIWYVSLFILSFRYPWLIIFLIMRGLLLVKVSYRPSDPSGLSPNFRFSLWYDFLLCLLYTGLSFTYLIPKRTW